MTREEFETILAKERRGLVASDPERTAMIDEAIWRIVQDPQIARALLAQWEAPIWESSNAEGGDV